MTRTRLTPEDADAPVRPGSALDPPDAGTLARFRLWLLVWSAVGLFILLCLSGLLVSASWNGLTEVTGLPEVTFNNGLQATVLVLVFGFIFGMGRR